MQRVPPAYFPFSQFPLSSDRLSASGSRCGCPVWCQCLWSLEMRRKTLAGNPDSRSNPRLLLQYRSRSPQAPRPVTRCDRQHIGVAKRHVTSRYFGRFKICLGDRDIRVRQRRTADPREIFNGNVETHFDSVVVADVAKSLPLPHLSPLAVGNMEKGQFVVFGAVRSLPSRSYPYRLKPNKSSIQFQP